MVVVLTGAIKRAVFAGVSATLYIVATEVLFSSNTFLLFLSSIAVVPFVVLTPIINHVRIFIAVRAQRNQVLGVAVSNQQRTTILRREKKVTYHIMILIAASLICLVPAGLLKTFASYFVQQYRYLFPWTLSFALINSSVNPIVNFWWNKELRHAIRSLVSC